MLNLIVAVIISLATITFGAPTVTVGLPPTTTTCTGGVQNGATTETGRFWYTCKDGKLTMMGCLSDKRTHLTTGQTFKSSGYLFECTPTTSGDFTFTYKGCVSENGEEHMPGGTWEDKNWWYTCTKTGDSVLAEVKGCVDDGKRMNPDDRVNKSDLIYECKRYDTGNIGWNIYPNRAETVTYNPTNDHIHFQQTMPVRV